MPRAYIYSVLIHERLGQIELGMDLIQRAISILEAVYEETEDPVVERQFTFANSNLARLRLSAHDYEGALESFECALGLLPEDSSLYFRSHPSHPRPSSGQEASAIQVGESARSFVAVRNCAGECWG